MKQFPLCPPDLVYHGTSLLKSLFLWLFCYTQATLNGAACIGNTVYLAAVFCLRIIEGFGLEESIKVIWFQPPALGWAVKSGVLNGCCKFWRNVKRTDFPFSASTAGSSSLLPTFCQPGEYPAVWCHAVHHGNYTAVGSGAQWLCLVRVHAAEGMGFLFKLMLMLMEEWRNVHFNMIL